MVSIPENVASVDWVRVDNFEGLKIIETFQSKKSSCLVTNNFPAPHLFQAELTGEMMALHTKALIYNSIRYLYINNVTTKRETTENTYDARSSRT